MLSKDALAAGLKAAFAAGIGGASQEQVAELLAQAIDTYVRTATVNVISVSGVATGGQASGPGTGTLS